MNPYKHNDRGELVTFPAVFGGTIGTATASEVSTVTASLKLPQLPAKFAVKYIKVRVVTAPTNAGMAELIHFLNGTTTFAIATMGTSTAGDWVNAIAVSYGTSQTELDYSTGGTFTPPTGPASVGYYVGQNTNAELAAGVAPTVVGIGTATASANTHGVYDIWITGKFIPS